MQNNPMSKEEFKTQKEAVLNGFQISAKPTIKSISALFFSGLISTFGIYSILLSMDIKDNALYKAIGIFIIILIVADTFKRGALANYLNSVTRNNILGNVKTRKMQLVISGLALSFMLVFDVVGSISTANYTEQSYQDFRATNSKEFELLEQKAKQGKETNSNYTLELKIWNELKSEEIARCATRNRTQKYRNICLDKWKATHAIPVNPKADTTVNVSDFKELKTESNEDFLSSYMFYIIFFLAMALTMLLQYTTLSEILEKHEDIDETLTPEVIGILQDRISELETNMIQHETKRNELISDSDREEKTHKRQFEKLGKAIKLLGISKAVDARGKTVQRVANNTYVPKEESKAGFVDFSFNTNDNNQTVNQTVNQSVKPKEETKGQKVDNEATVNQTVITEPLTEWLDIKKFTNEELKLIDILWDKGNVKANDSLTIRRDILKVIGDTKVNTTLLRDLYKKLIGLDYIYKRVGYFAKVNYSA